MYAIKVASAIYTTKPTPIAHSVPEGIDFLGSFKSPLIAIPAVKPVTAGKNMAKTTSKDTELLEEKRETSVGLNSEVPKNIETKEIRIPARIKN